MTTTTAKVTAQELRIGNWVQKDGQYHHIEFGIDIDDYTDMAYEPVPLTPEILEKCGFEWDAIIHRWKHTCGYRIIQDNLGFKNGLGDGSFKQPRLEFLHQLQNLYFALTGEELPIDL